MQARDHRSVDFDQIKRRFTSTRLRSRCPKRRLVCQTGRRPGPWHQLEGSTDGSVAGLLGTTTTTGIVISADSRDREGPSRGIANCARRSAMPADPGSIPAAPPKGQVGGPFARNATAIRAQVSCHGVNHLSPFGHGESRAHGRCRSSGSDPPGTVSLFPRLQLWSGKPQVGRRRRHHGYYTPRHRAGLMTTAVAPPALLVASLRIAKSTL